MTRTEEEIDCVITGRVQGVMFRDFAERKARSLGLVGSVENKGDGSVRVVAQGSKDALEQLVAALHRGPFLSRVDGVTVAWRAPTESFNSFFLIR